MKNVLRMGATVWALALTTGSVTLADRDPCAGAGQDQTGTLVGQVPNTCFGDVPPFPLSTAHARD